MTYLKPSLVGVVLALVAATRTALADDRYPRAVIARPLTLPKALVVIGADLDANHDLTAVGGVPVVGVGITDALDVIVPYAFEARELEPRGSLDVDAGYKLVRGAAGGRLEIIARGRAGYHVLERTANPIALGVHVQYNVTDHLAIISGGPGNEQLRISVAPDAMTQQHPIDVALPVAIGVQALPTLYLQLDTRLFQVSLHESANLMFGADATPLSVTAVYNAWPALDLQVAIGTDLSNGPADALTFLVGARYYAGSL